VFYSARTIFAFSAELQMQHGIKHTRQSTKPGPFPTLHSALSEAFVSTNIISTLEMRVMALFQMPL